MLYGGIYIHKKKNENYKEYLNIKKKLSLYQTTKHKHTKDPENIRPQKHLT